MTHPIAAQVDLTIRGLKARPADIVPARPVETAAGTMATTPLVLIDLQTREGIVGRAYVRCYTSLALPATARLIEDLDDAVAGQRLDPAPARRAPAKAVAAGKPRPRRRARMPGATAPRTPPQAAPKNPLSRVGAGSRVLLTDRPRGEGMYEKDGEKYFVVDSHLHFWDASPGNWLPGQEQYAKGWIECFHAYMGLGPAETHWPLEKFMKYSEEDFVHDVFEEGHVDVGIFQSTYLKSWYRDGFNTAERNATLAEKYPDRLIVNGRFDPREGEAGLRQLEADARRYNLKGVKVYTAEWHNGSRGWKLTDPEAQMFLDKCKELGIKNVHAHKGPTIWPLDKDAFDVKDIDVAATMNPELNFIVEHVGLPRIEDFCFMATQEPNVYAGLAVVIGGLMHSRPRFFNRVMGELLFWVGEDKMLFASDYAIWEPKWQVEAFLDWTMPDREEYSDYPAVTTATKKKIMGLNAAKLYGIEVPPELRLPEAEPAAQEAAQLVESA
jgi:predicted TIM-barrel fold metal-dependent hydrolase